MIEEPTNRELMHFIKDIKENVSDIKFQTTTTNGKVAEIQKWKERMMGGIYVIMIILLPILSWALYQISTIDQKVQNGVSTVLSNEYNIKTQ